MKRWLYLTTSFLVLVVLNVLIVEKERVLEQGDVIRLELRPLDPRSMLQGDFMILNYALSTEVPRDYVETASRKGTLVVSLDANRVASFERFDDGSPLQENERRLVFYKRDESGSGLFGFVFSGRGEIWPGPNAWFFQEGQADVFAGALYAELRVSDDGERILTGVLGADFQPLAP